MRRFSTFAPSVKLESVVSTQSVPALGAFCHYVAGVVDDIGVVARAANHQVGACAAVERVVAGAARSITFHRSARCQGLPVITNRCRANRQVFNVRIESVEADGGFDRIDAPSWRIR